MTSFPSARSPLAYAISNSARSRSSSGVEAGMRSSNALMASGASTVEFDKVEFRYPSASEVSLASLESVAVLDTSTNAQVLFDVSFKAEAGQLVEMIHDQDGVEA